MKRNKVRVLYVVLTCFLFFQFVYSIKISEPYPAIRLPGFGKIPEYSTTIKHIKYEIRAYSSDKNYVQVNSEELFENFPRVYIPVLLKNVFTKYKSETIKKNQQDFTKFKIWLSSRLYKIYRKDYCKLEIRKLEVNNNMELDNAVLEQVNLEDSIVIML